jgi:hypothetical protein
MEKLSRTIFVFFAFDGFTLGAFAAASCVRLASGLVAELGVDGLAFKATLFVARGIWAAFTTGLAARLALTLTAGLLADCCAGAGVAEVMGVLVALTGLLASTVDWFDSMKDLNLINDMYSLYRLEKSPATHCAHFCVIADSGIP